MSHAERDLEVREPVPLADGAAHSEMDGGRVRRAWLAHMRHELRAPAAAILDYSQLLLEDSASSGLGEFAAELEKIQSAGQCLVQLVDQLLDPEQVKGQLHLDAEAFGAKIRHDLRTPLNAVIGYSEMVLEDADDSGLEHLVTQVRNIHAAGKKLLALIDDLVRFPSVEAGKAASPPAPGRDAAERLAVQPTIGPGAGSREPGAASEASFTASMIRDVITTIRPLEEGPARVLGLGGSLLVVDDSDSGRDLLARRLEREGYRVTPARNGREALERLRAEPFDLVLLDILMPEMNGYQVLERMKGDPALRHVPVIMISALDELDAVVRCIEMGAEDYLSKPFSPVLLRARIGACLEKKRLRDQEQRTHQALVESQQRLAVELAEAAEYVRSLLPPPLSGAPATEWQFVPSSQLGGDSFGYHWIDADHFAIYLLDACGHGVGPALLSVSAMNCLRAQMLPGTDFCQPGEVLRALNRTFQMRAQNDTYFTIWYGVYHRGERRLTYASGGHPPAILLPGRAGGAVPLRTRGPIIGALPDVPYKSESCVLEQPSRLFVFSDGAYEVTRPDGAMLTLDELTALLSQPPEPGVATVDRVLHAIQELHGSPSLEDDFSLVQVTFG
jgi:sigma-B regulation protein RsbU (phosphoserine phosphatase)